MLIDIHAHFDMLETSHDETIRLAKEAGVSQMITIGTEPSDHGIVLEIAQKYFPVVACTLGVHPHQGNLWSPEVADYLRKNLLHKEVVGLGEIGLDYFYNQSPVDEQRKAFSEQLEIAAELKMPVQIHTREAEKDTFEILKSFNGKVSGVIHCYTSSLDLAKKCLDLGYNISFSGIVTFKNADDLRETCKQVPLERLHVETDAPFLAPVPERGKKNTPAFVAHTARFVAALRGLEYEHLAAVTSANARQLFPKLN